MTSNISGLTGTTTSDCQAIARRQQSSTQVASRRNATTATATNLVGKLTAALLATVASAAVLQTAAAAAGSSTSLPVPTAKAWLSNGASGLKIEAAPAARPTELDALKAITAKRTADDIVRYQWWATGGPVYRWNQILLEEMQESFVVLPMAARHLALFHTALDDAIAAARRMQSRAAGTTRPEIDTALDPKRKASGPSEHAAAAAAAGEVLGYLFPARAAQLAAKSEEAMQSRLIAGVELPHESSTGRRIGRQTAALAIARGKSDGSDAKWNGSVPEGTAQWKGTNPIMPQAAQWRTWVLASASELRPPAPPEVGSEQVKAALAELKGFQRTPKSNHRATYWEVHGGARAHTLWNDTARTLLIEHGNAPEVASRVLAALNVAMADAGIACWDAKFAFWYIRPPQLDPDLKSLFAPPNHPSFPAAHGCFSTAAATVLAGVFPHDRARLMALAKEAAEARIWAGIHYRFDIDAGQEIGRNVGEKVLRRAFDAPTL